MFVLIQILRLENKSLFFFHNSLIFTVFQNSKSRKILYLQIMNKCIKMTQVLNLQNTHRTMMQNVCEYDTFILCTMNKSY